MLGGLLVGAGRVFADRLRRRAVDGHRRLRDAHRASSSYARPESSARTPSRRYERDARHARAPPAETPEPQTPERNQPHRRRQLGRGVGARRSRTPAAWSAAAQEARPTRSSSSCSSASRRAVPFWSRTRATSSSSGSSRSSMRRSALGLNVVVGFAGLLDLGYVAFSGIGAYTYALLSSPRWGLHWPAEATIPIAMAAAGARRASFSVSRPGGCSATTTRSSRSSSPRPSSLHEHDEPGTTSPAARTDSRTSIRSPSSATRSSRTSSSTSSC